MKGLDFYIERFGKLKTAYSKSRPAPHKALLLLSVIEIIERGVITSPKIELSDVLIETFKSNANDLFHDDFFKPSIGQPFFFMKSEPFWQLVANDVSDLELKSTSYSVVNLRKRFRYALIDTELFVLLKDNSNREALREVLLHKYLTL